MRRRLSETHLLSVYVTSVESFHFILRLTNIILQYKSLTIVLMQNQELKKIMIPQDPRNVTVSLVNLKSNVNNYHTIEILLNYQNQMCSS